MRASAESLLLLALAPAVVLAAAGAPVAGYPDAPPPGHTGGFGEPSCHACHFDADVNEPGGTLVVEGVPERYEPGETYRLAVVVSHPDLAGGGFQMSARHPDGTQAGSLEPVDARVATMAEGDVVYAYHTAAGLAPVESGAVRWIVEWTAPAAGGDVVFHVAANASDGDESPFGDRIYTLETRSTTR